MKQSFFFLVIKLSIYLLITPFLASYVFAGTSHSSIAILAYGAHNLPTVQGFIDGFKGLDYYEKENVAFIFNGTIKNKRDIESEMKKLIKQKPDLIFACTTPATRIAQKATQKNKIPVIFAPVQDPVNANILKNLKQPGGNITGIRLTDSTVKQLEWMLRLAPKTQSILLPYNPDDKSSDLSYQKIKKVAKLFKLEVVSKELRSHKDIDTFLENFPKQTDGIFLPRDGMIMARVKDFAKIARTQKLAISGTRFEMAEQGALLGFGFSGYELGKQAARMAGQVLRGANPGKLPVETAEDYLSINLKAAQKMGLKIPEHILRQAHIIIRE